MKKKKILPRFWLFQLTWFLVNQTGFLGKTLIVCWCVALLFSRWWGRKQHSSQAEDPNDGRDALHGVSSELPGQPNIHLWTERLEIGTRSRDFKRTSEKRQANAALTEYLMPIISQRQSIGYSLLSRNCPLVVVGHPRVCVSLGLRLRWKRNLTCDQILFAFRNRTRNPCPLSKFFIPSIPTESGKTRKSHQFYRYFGTQSCWRASIKKKKKTMTPPLLKKNLVTAI